MVDFDLFLIEFLFSLKLSLEFLVRSEKFKVLKVILDDRIPKFNIDLQLLFVSLLLGLFDRIFVLFIALILSGLVDQFTKRVFIVVCFFVVLRLYLFLFLLFEGLLDRVFTIRLAKELRAFAQLRNKTFLVIFFALLERFEVKVCHLSFVLSSRFEIIRLSLGLNLRFLINQLSVGLKGRLKIRRLHIGLYGRFFFTNSYRILFFLFFGRFQLKTNVLVFKPLFRIAL